MARLSYCCALVGDPIAELCRGGLHIPFGPSLHSRASGRYATCRPPRRGKEELPLKANRSSGGVAITRIRVPPIGQIPCRKTNGERVSEREARRDIRVHSSPGLANARSVDMGDTRTHLRISLHVRILVSKARYITKWLWWAS